jgi:hypothetical protein
MKRFVLIGVGLLAMSGTTLAQAPAGNFDAALAAAPAQMRDGALVIKWKADGTYDTLRPGTNQLVCYDQSGEPSEQPFSSQCTSVGNLDRVKQNKQYEAKEPDRAKREAALAELEKAAIWLGVLHGERQGSGHGSPPRHHLGAGRDHRDARPARQRQGRRGVDYGCGHQRRAHHDAGVVRLHRRGLTGLT